MGPDYTLMAILIASLLGSSHCVGMCGGFVGIAQHGSQPLSRAVAYNLGRAVTYATLGMIAGYAGQSLNRFGVVLNIQFLAGIIMGGVIVLVGASQVGGWQLPIPRSLRACAAKPLKALMGLQDLLSPTKFAFFVGLSSTLLPCGWLYLFLTVAVGSGSASSGAAVMLVFWLGTLPALLSVAGFVRVLATGTTLPLRRVGGALLVLTGLLSLAMHFDIVSFPGHDHSSPGHDHGAHQHSPSASESHHHH